MDNQEHPPGIIWRHEEWRCEYAASSSGRGGTLHLYLRSTQAMSRQVQSVEEMLWIAAEWKQVIVAKPLRAMNGSAIPERRQPPAERRAKPRGGRREGDAKP
jgi:hypothetical protein